MTLNFHEIVYAEGQSLDLQENSVDVMLLNTNFPISEIYKTISIVKQIQDEFLHKITVLVHQLFKSLKNGGLFFVYGIPRYLVFYGDCLNHMADDASKMIFKNWIALDINDGSRRDTLKPVHIGLLMYLKTTNGRSTSPFHLNTKEVRIPYSMCEHCQQNTRDWGGKKHLINPLGACVSDVWRDMHRMILKDHLIPESILNRIYELTKKVPLDTFTFVVAKEQDCMVREVCQPSINNIKTNLKNARKFVTTATGKPEIDASLKRNVVINDDCINVLEELSNRYPDGVVDLFFADPPYNLAKSYSNYEDEIADKEYLAWCETWLEAGCNALRPGGAMLVLNLPKWAIYHAKFLMRHMEFRHWIAWDALSSPAGKIMPAHYALLYFTKPGGPVTFNYETKEQGDMLSPVDADRYCLRARCIKERKELGIDEKIDLTDVWWDIHRIKHKKDRDFHPCQLPLELMHRIINMTTNRGDLVFDPFSGAGTTAVSARMFGRDFIVTDLDNKYVDITNANLGKIVEENGVKHIKRESTKKERIIIPKKIIETEYFQLCAERNDLVMQDTLVSIRPELAAAIRQYYPSFKTLVKRARRNLEMHGYDEKESKS